MKKQPNLLRNFVGVFIFWGILIFSANPASAQCGNYFKTNYNVKNNVAAAVSREPKLDDWTGDGRSDFWNFRFNQNTSRLEVIIYPSKPTGYWDWTAPIIYSTSIVGDGDYSVRDVDADGRADLIYGYPGSMQIHRNAGNGTLVASPVLADSDGSFVSTSHVGFIDVNGDNLLDWVYAVFVNSNFVLRYQLQSSNGSFANKTNVLTGFTPSSNALGDFNGDGKTDIIFSSSPNTYVLVKNLGNGTFEVGSPTSAEITVFRNPVRDFNNDGIDDIVSRTSIFYGHANGVFTRTPLPAVNTALLPAKLNADNNIDIVEFGATSYAALINDGAGGFTRTVYPKALVPSGAGTAIGWKFEDFSGDGKDDFYDGRVTSPVYNYNAFGERFFTIKENVCQMPGETKIADFDDNETADLTTWNAAGGIWSAKNANYTTSETTARTFQWGAGASGDIPAPGDFDGDGKTDYAVYRTGTGAWYILRSSDSTLSALQFGATGDVAVPNDYDGGGKTDIAVYRPSQGDWYFWSSETQQFRGLHFGTNGDKPVPADYDGDGKTDAAVFRPSSGYWYYLTSSNGSFVGRQWGIASDKLVPADYDADGRADLAVYRDGVWWVARSSDNAAVAVQWGTASDIPIPVYRNSLNAEFTVYRPSDKTWRSYEYRNAQGNVVLGTNQDVPVYFGLPNN